MGGKITIKDRGKPDNKVNQVSKYYSKNPIRSTVTSPPGKVYRSGFMDIGINESNKQGADISAQRGQLRLTRVRASGSVKRRTSLHKIIESSIILWKRVQTLGQCVDNEVGKRKRPKKAWPDVKDIRSLRKLNACIRLVQHRQGEEGRTTFQCDTNQDLPGSTMRWLIKFLRPEYRFAAKKRQGACVNKQGSTLSQVERGEYFY